MSSPTISAVVRVYNCEEYISETLRSIISQTRPPDEVVVVDDGSTDGTSERLAQFNDTIRIVRQPNSGLAAAFNRGFLEARGDYVAICDADDLWLPHKLERQSQVISDHPEIDVAFSAAWVFGQIEGPWGMSVAGDSSVGILSPGRFRRTLYRVNVVCTSSVLIRKSLFGTFGPFEEHHGAEDYDYWMRALAGGAVFYYDPETLTRYRKHGSQVTSSTLAARQSGFEVRALHPNLVPDRRFVRTVLGTDLFKIGRLRVDEDRAKDARQAFRLSLRYGTGETAVACLRALVWVAILCLPTSWRGRTAPLLVRVSRVVDELAGGRRPALP